MLRINSLQSIGGAKEYYTKALQHESYYAGELESAGVWGGRGAERLGLEGEVTRDQFFNLLENRDPVSGDQLSGHTRSNRRPGWDFTFSVPKSVSVAAAFTGDERFNQVVHEAVDETMAELEQDARVRVRKDGRDETRQGDGLIYSKYLHKTARPTDHNLGTVEPDAHWHVHTVVSNHSYDAVEKKWKAADIGQVWKDASYYEAAFDARVAEKLRGLGLAIERTSGKGWEIVGVPETVRAKFSRRTAEVEQHAADMGDLTADQKGRLGALTRQQKETQTSLEELRSSWIGRLDAGEKEAVRKALRGGVDGPEGPKAQESLDHAVQGAFERKSVLSEKRLMESALRHGVASVTVEEAWSAAKRDKRLIRRDVDGETLTTTKEVLQEEKRMVDWARRGKGSVTPLVGAERPIERDFLNKGQQAAVRHVWESKDRVTMIRGGAGVGKTTLMQEAIPAIREQGAHVQVLAPSADASRSTLRQDGFHDADTIAKFLIDTKMQNRVRNGVIWVDESGLVGAPTMARLFDVAQAQDARVVLSGDVRQHAPVERGDAMKSLERHAGITPAEVKDIQRQKGQYKALVEAIERGDQAGVAEGFKRLDDRGWIKEVASDEDRYDALAKEYADKSAGRFQVRNRKRAKEAENLPAGKQKVLVVAPTHAEGQKVTERVRTELRDRGRLGEEEQAVERWRSLNWDEAQRSDAVNYEAGLRVKFRKPGHGARRGERFEVLSREGEEVRVRSLDGKKDLALPLKASENFQVYRRDWIGLSVGDQVRVTDSGLTHTNASNKKHELRTGSLYEVAGFEKETGHIRLTNGWVVDRGFAHLTHGYASTSHGSQGKTVDHCLLASSSTSLPAVSREQFYVSLSRGRRGVTVYTDSVDDLRQAAADSSGRMGALDLKETPANDIEQKQLRDRTLRHQEHTRQSRQPDKAEVDAKKRAPTTKPAIVPGE